MKSWADQVVVGMSPPDLPLSVFAWVGGAVAIAAALYWAARGDRARTETVAVGGVTLLAIGLSLLLGKDFLLGRNMIGVWPAMAALVAVGVASLPRRVAIVPALLVAVPAVIATGALAVDTDLQRPDFKGLAQGLGPPKHGQIIVLSGDYSALPLGYYLNVAEQPPEVPVPATEIVAVASKRRPNARSCESGAVCNLGFARPADPPLQGDDLAGVKLVERRTLGNWQIAVFRSARPVAITRDVSFRLFENARGPQRYVHGSPP